MSFLKSVGNILGSGLSMATLGFSGNSFKKLFDPNQYSGAYQQADANAQAMKAWNLMNDYNHPIHQMERLKAAGLNPLLVYGSGSVAGNTTSSPALTGGGISTEAESSFAGLNNIMGSLQGVANLRQTNAATRASVAAAGASGAQAANLNAQAAFQETKNAYAEKSMIADLDYKKAQTRLAKAQIGVAGQQSRKIAAEADIARGEADIFGAVGGSKSAVAGAGAVGKAAKIIRGIFRK